MNYEYIKDMCNLIIVLCEAEKNELHDVQISKLIDRLSDEKR
jgi:hypothetical protein